MEDIGGFDRRALDRARASRDPRFDGKFFIAVTTTGIYCRPICPVRSPKTAHIRYYATAAAAAEAGFRPCLRCRPEAAPGTPAWLGTSAVVRRALRLIDDGVLETVALFTGTRSGPSPHSPCCRLAGRLVMPLACDRTRWWATCASRSAPRGRLQPGHERAFR